MKINMKEYNLDYFKEKDLYEWDEIISIIEDLECENKSLKEKINDLEEDMRYNYKPISKEEEYDF